MGAFASHIIFGWEGKKKWQECGMLSVCRKHQGIFEMGCQGPDLFLYNPAMLFSTYDKNLGERMHVEKCGRFMACLADVIRQQEEKEIIFQIFPSKFSWLSAFAFLRSLLQYLIFLQFL